VTSQAARKDLIGGCPEDAASTPHGFEAVFVHDQVLENALHRRSMVCLLKYLFPLLIPSFSLVFNSGNLF